MMYKSVFLVVISILLAGCSASVPKVNKVVDELPGIYPDYVDVTVPSNIAPLRFKVSGQVEDAIALLSYGDYEWVEKANDGSFLFSEKEWHHLMNMASGDSVSVTIFEKNSGEWCSYRPFYIHVSELEIDNYLAYRLIPPGYEQWHQMGLYQRDLTSYKEETIVDNRQTDFNCINCHSFCMQYPRKPYHPTFPTCHWTTHKCPQTCYAYGKPYHQDYACRKSDN